MFRRDDLTFFPGGADERPLGQEIGPAQQTAGALMNGQKRLVGKQLFLDAGDFQVMLDITGHVFVLEPVKMAFAEYSGGQRPGGVKHQIIHQIVLPGQNHGQ
ncbi:MAG: hypothetical protein BWX44_01570 [Spirochaetes bacterium ADurb.Bin001]|nr:MAG: hypothetical protein BWX44_01570 [Spirochaetes bacterium ADurb.Bin001]